MTYDYRLLIDGKWRSGSGGRNLGLINPATEALIGSVACASTSDIDEAIDAARSAQPEWAALAPEERGAILRRAAKVIERRIDEAARALSDEQGKTIAEAMCEYRRAIENLYWNGEHAADLCAPIALDGARELRPQPAGIVAAFTPWNYPAVLNARKLAQPLAVGCTVILNCAEEAPSSAVILAEALIEAGLPDGVVSVLFGEPAEISTRLLGSRDVRVVSFTGSTPVGKELAALAATNLQRCVLELGGHAPVVIFDDADLPAAGAEIVDYKFECAGQSCNAPSRIFVQRTVHDVYLEQLVAAAGSLKMGAGSDPATQMGPMANARRIDAMKRLTRDAAARGATVVLGGAAPERVGFYWPATVLTDVPADALVMTEEPYGPILTVTPFDDKEQAVSLANATNFGLAAYQFTRSADL